jgi:TolA-binding protein
VRLTLLVLLLATTATAAPPTTCRLDGDYERALCAYQRRQFAAAETGFRALAGRERQDAQTLRSIYFLARTLMKTGRFEEASTLLIRIYALDQPFYETWNCDFLLGECRKALGK